MPSAHSIQVWLCLSPNLELMLKPKQLPTAALTGDVHEANSENPDLNPKASTSKAEGKKRAINDDDDATATDDEGPTPGKSTKKKRAK